MKLRVKIGLLIGNILHHYDTSLFGWVAPFLAPILFPEKSGAEALLLTFAFLPLSYLTKPIGALFWGFLGDKIGRKPVLVATMTGTALSTFAIGCLPLMPGAWMILALCRICQGFFSAGEEKGAALFLLEQSDQKKHSWLSALYDSSGILGIFLASLLVSLFGEVYWRPLFWLGAATGLFAIFMRKSSKETEHKPTKVSWSTLWSEKIPLFRVMIVSGFSYANYFLLSVFLNGFLPQVTSLTKTEVLTFNTYLLWLDSLLLLFFGYLCRFIQKEKIMAFGAFMAAFVALPLFNSLEGATYWQAAFTRLILMVSGVALAAPYHAWKLEVLPLKHRFLIGGLGSTLGAKLFGAPMPLFSTWLVAETGYVWSAALPIVFLGLASSYVILSEARQRAAAKNALS